jgi:hypothetical protein
MSRPWLRARTSRSSATVRATYEPRKHRSARSLAVVANWMASPTPSAIRADAIRYQGRGLAGRCRRIPPTTAAADPQCTTAEKAAVTRSVSGSRK